MENFEERLREAVREEAQELRIPDAPLSEIRHRSDAGRGVQSPARRRLPWTASA